VFYYVLKYVILGPLLRLLFRPRIEGLEHIPAEGAAIVAGNHLSFSDHFLMPAIIKRRITFLAKAEYFTGPGLKGRLTAAFFRSAGQIPVDRSGSCWGSTPKAPAPTTAGSTRARSVSP
jgi:1-acyl-sn-glycerol-3-phosphate acyltransferase